MKRNGVILKRFIGDESDDRPDGRVKKRELPGVSSRLSYSVHNRISSGRATLYVRLKVVMGWLID